MNITWLSIFEKKCLAFNMYLNDEKKNKNSQIFFPKFFSYDSRSLSYLDLFNLFPKTSIALLISIINLDAFANFSSLSEFLSGCHFNAATL